MRRVLVFLRIVAGGRVEEKVLPETLVNEEIVRLTKKVPRTKAEQAFHAWLSDWHERSSRG